MGHDSPSAKTFEVHFAMRAIAVLLFIISFLGYCLFANRRLRLPLEMTPFFSASAIISSLYAFGCLGSLSFNRFGIPIL
jgi:hypothetical protein